MYREIFAPVDNSQHSDWAVDRAIELVPPVRAAASPAIMSTPRALHDVRFRQLETGLPLSFRRPTRSRSSARSTTS